jgi:hypothetical protein
MPMTFDEVLSEIQGLLGEEIIVAVLSYRTTPGGQLSQQMHALFAGRLRRATEESELENVTDEGIAFIIGEREEPGDFSKIYLKEDSFLDARKDPYGQLVIIAAEGVTIQITRAPTRRKGPSS